MNVTPSPDPRRRRDVEAACRGEMHRCWTCGSCDLECPVNIATGRLRPQEMVRLAALGFLDELLDRPEIWYCLTCRRCSRVCPNEVKPALLIEYSRAEAAAAGRIDPGARRVLLEVFSRFQRVRRRAAEECLAGETVETDRSEWLRLLNCPPAPEDGDPLIPRNPTGTARTRELVESGRSLACFTCSECSSACPVVSGGGVFDPKRIVRRVNLGRVDELLDLPDIWLCIGCGRCTEACSQGVDVRGLIESLCALAAEAGRAGPAFRERWYQAQKRIHPLLLDEIDRLLTVGKTAVLFLPEASRAPGGGEGRTASSPPRRPAGAVVG